MPALAEPPTIAASPSDKEEFVDMGWFPFFSEHTNRDGVKFDRQALETIVNRCNERIDETGDYAPLVLSHTRDEDPDHVPEYVGLIGPFRLGRIGKRKQRWAIFGQERVRKEKLQKLREFPRRSVEYWADKNSPTAGFFDPISALPAATTPELDLGLRYEHVGEKIRYSRVAHNTRKYAAMPGGSNTAVPALAETQEKPDRYQQGGTLTQADLLQIVEALRPVIQESVKSEVAAMQPVGADPNGLLTDPTDELDGGNMGLGDDSDLEDVEDPGEFAGDDADFDADDEDTEGLEDADAGDQIPEEHADMPAEEADPTEQLGEKKKDQYARQSSDPLENPMPESLEQQVTRYQKEAGDLRTRYEATAKENGELKTKYQKAEAARRELEGQNQQLTERLSTVEESERKATRYQKLREKADLGHVFDIDEEYEDTKAFDETQFAHHCEHRIAKYQRIPKTLSASGIKPAGPARTGADDHKDAKKRDRYSKQAMDNVARARKENKSLDFKPEFDRLMRDNPENL
jgi:hypothetical protein